MKVFTGLFCLLLLVGSCDTHKKDWKFSKDAVSFTGSGDWYINKANKLAGGNGYYVSVRKSGWGSSGLFIITWINVEADKVLYMSNMEKNFKSKKILNDVVFDPIVEEEFAGNKGISSTFRLSSIGVKHQGKIYIFSKDGKTYCVTMQEALKDINENEEGYSLINSTIRIH